MVDQKGLPTPVVAVYRTWYRIYIPVYIARTPAIPLGRFSGSVFSESQGGVRAQQNWRLCGEDLDDIFFS